MTMIMGQSALQIPSKAAVAALIALICHTPIARAIVTTNAIRQALYPGIFNTLIAMINQMIGSNAKANNTNIFILCFPFLRGHFKTMKGYCLSQIEKK